MEKNILQRLAAYLRDLRRPRLVVIEGGKGKGERDGNEGMNSPAVIGIPYSSDTARETVEEGEEDPMKKFAKYMLAIGAAVGAAFVLGACGGGGGGGSTGATSAPVVSSGTMTKGSVIVNGVRFEDTAADIHPDDTGKVFLPSDLEDGMTVKVKGEINDDRVTGQALEIEVENEVRGTVTAVGTDTFTVLGQTVFVDAATVFANVAGIGGLVAGTSAVEVHGQRDATGTIRATRVELLGAGVVVDEVRGVVANKTPGAAGTFTIGGGTFSFDAGTAIVGGVAFNDGDLVEIHLDAGTTRANRIELEDAEDNEFEPAQGQEFEVEGFVSGFTAHPGTFQVGTQAVTTTAATVFRNGSALDLDNDVKVEVEGHFDNVTQVLTATKVEFKHTRVILGGIPSAVNLPDNITILGKTVKFTSATRNDAGTIDDVARIEVRAFVDNTGTIVAERVKSLGGNRDIVQARVTAESGNVLTLLGFTADLTGISVSNLSADDEGTFADLAAFLAAITPSGTTPPGTLVKVKGTVTGSAFATPPAEVEIEMED